MDHLFESEPNFGHEWEQAELLAEEAFDLYEKGQMRHAFEKMTEAVEKGPENGCWYFNMGLALDGMEQYEKAIFCYEKALELLDDDIEVMNCLGVDYTRTAQYDRALTVFERIEQIDPLFEPAYCNRIITYTEMDQHDKAEQMFYLAQQIHSDCPLCFYNIGNSLFSRGAYERAIWCWQKTAEVDPSHPQIQYRLAQAYWVSGKGQQAHSAFLNEIRKNPADLDVLLDFGVFLLESGDIEAAKEKFNRILEFDPHFSAAQFYLGEVYRLRGRTDAAVRHYQQAMNADGRMTGPRYRLAEILIRQGLNDRAKALLWAEFKMDVPDLDVLVGMGAMFLQLDDSEGAAQCFLRALEVEHREPRAFRGLALALTLRGEYAGARQCLEQALRLNDEDAMTLLDAAWICARLGDWDAAKLFASRGQALRGGQEPYRTACETIQRDIQRGQLSAFWRRFHIRR